MCCKQHCNGNLQSILGYKAALHLAISFASEVDVTACSYLLCPSSIERHLISAHYTLAGSMHKFAQNDVVQPLTQNRLRFLVRVAWRDVLAAWTIRQRHCAGAAFADAIFVATFPAACVLARVPAHALGAACRPSRIRALLAVCARGISCATMGTTQTGEGLRRQDCGASGIVLSVIEAHPGGVVASAHKRDE
jgi:hypothetical protein